MNTRFDFFTSWKIPILQIHVRLPGKPFLLESREVYAAMREVALRVVPDVRGERPDPVRVKDCARRKVSAQWPLDMLGFFDAAAGIRRNIDSDATSLSAEKLHVAFIA